MFARSVSVSLFLYLSLASCLFLSLCMKYVCFMAAFVLTCRSTWAKCCGTYVFNLLANGKTWLNSTCRTKMKIDVSRQRSLEASSTEYSYHSLKLPSTTITTTANMYAKFIISQSRVRFPKEQHKLRLRRLLQPETAHTHTHTPMATTSIIRTVPPWEVTFALLAMHEQLRELASSVDTGLESLSSHSTYRFQFLLLLALLNASPNCMQHYVELALSSLTNWTTAQPSQLTVQIKINCEIKRKLLLLPDKHVVYICDIYV